MTDTGSNKAFWGSHVGEKVVCVVAPVLGHEPTAIQSESMLWEAAVKAPALQVFVDGKAGGAVLAPESPAA